MVAERAVNGREMRERRERRRGNDFPGITLSREGLEQLGHLKLFGSGMGRLPETRGALVSTESSREHGNWPDCPKAISSGTAGGAICG